jgi:hypothetical protein
MQKTERNFTVANRLPQRIVNGPLPRMLNESRLRDNDEDAWENENRSQTILGLQQKVQSLITERENLINEREKLLDFVNERTTHRPQTGELLPIHESKVWGEVIEKNERQFVVRFNVGGIREEREFCLKDVSIDPNQIEVGMEVIAETRLGKASLPGTGLAPQETAQMEHRVHQEALHISGGDDVISESVTEEEQTAITEYYEELEAQTEGVTTL